MLNPGGWGEPRTTRSPSLTDTVSNRPLHLRDLVHPGRNLHLGDGHTTWWSIAENNVNMPFSSVQDARRTLPSIASTHRGMPQPHSGHPVQHIRINTAQHSTDSPFTRPPEGAPEMTPSRTERPQQQQTRRLATDLTKIQCTSQHRNQRHRQHKTIS